MDVRDIQNFKKFVDALGKKLADDQKFFTLKLANRLSEATKLYPTDQTVIHMANFLSKRAQAGSYLISRSELSDAYNRLHTTNTKCASLLSEELGKPEDRLPQAHKTTRSQDEGMYMDDLYGKYADKKLVNEFEAAFDKSAKYRPYSDDAAKSAVKIVKDILGANASVSAVDGKDYAILCQATFETPKGRSHIIVPVETVNDKALIPGVFLSQAGFIDFNKENVEKHIMATAGKSFKVDASQVLEAIKVAKFGASKEVDSVDMAVFAFKARNGTPSNYTNDAILYQEVDKVASEVNLKTAESDLFSEKLKTTDGTAEFVLGKKNIDIGRNIVAKELSSMGYKSASIKVASFTDNSFTLAVSANGSGFKVPVKVEKGSVVYPTVILAGGNIEKFCKDGIKSALASNDQKAAVTATNFSLMTSSQLINEVEKLCMAGDLDSASDALSAIQLTGDEKALSYAFATYMSAMDGSLSKKAEIQKIKTIKIGGNEVCAQTFLPVDKVYIDENGVAHAKYHQNSDKTDSVTAAGLMNAKIIMGL